MKTYRDHMRAAAKEYLDSVVKRANGNISLAAKIAGVNRTDFYKKLDRYECEYERKPRARNLGNQAWQELGRMQ